MSVGRVAWFNDAKGFGFIEPKGGGPDTFAHFSAIEMEGFRSVEHGGTVSHELVQRRKGKLAKSVRLMASQDFPQDAAQVA